MIYNLLFISVPTCMLSSYWMKVYCTVKMINMSCQCCLPQHEMLLTELNWLRLIWLFSYSTISTTKKIPSFFLANSLWIAVNLGKPGKHYFNEFQHLLCVCVCVPHLLAPQNCCQLKKDWKFKIQIPFWILIIFFLLNSGNSLIYSLYFEQEIIFEMQPLWPLNLFFLPK